MTKAAEAVIAELKEYYGKKNENCYADPLRVFVAVEAICRDMDPILTAFYLIHVGGNKQGINGDAAIAKAVSLIDVALEEIKEVREILRKHLPAKTGEG